jgi:hypothetical protein
MCTLTSVAGPDPGSGAFLTPGSEMGKKSGSGSGMNNPDHISLSLETIFWIEILKFLKRIRAGFRIRIRIRIGSVFNRTIGSGSGSVI